MSVVHVAVGVVVKPGTACFDRQILISKRPDHVHQGGLWEFPGGKVESGENVRTALARELEEELGIQIDIQSQGLRPLIKIHHDYGDKKVVLDVWEVLEFSAEPHGKEGQPVKWVNLQDLKSHAFPAANQPIVSACCLPRRYVITPEYRSFAEARENISALVAKGAELILFRQPHLNQETYIAWSRQLLLLCRAPGVKFIASGAASILDQVDFDGVHLPWREASLQQERRLSRSLILGVSCHNADEIRHAELIDVDFTTLSPVCETASHPDAVPLGWQTFNTIASDAKVPVFALGGLELTDLSLAINSGAQGLAGISLWQRS